MRPPRLLTIVVLCTAWTFQCWGQKIWDRRFGGTSNDYCQVVLETSDGGYIAAGYSMSSVSGNRTEPTWGVNDYWLVKVNTNGAKQWDKRFGGNGSDYAYSIRQTADGGYIVGGQSTTGINGDKTESHWGQGDYWIVKVASNGAKQWDKRFGGTDSDELRSVLQTPDGGYFLAGHSLSGLNGDKSESSRGSNDFWVVKTTTNGVKQWDKRYGGSGNEALRSACLTSDGGYLLAGYSDSGIGGDKSEASRGSNDFWIVKISSTGVKQWDKRFGGGGDDRLMSIRPTADDGYILAGTSDSPIGGDRTDTPRGGRDFWVVKVDAAGNKQWDKAFGATGWEWAYDIRQTIDGGYVVGGMTTSDQEGDITEPTRGNVDYWIVKMSDSGAKQWDRRFGGANWDQFLSLDQCVDGSFIFGGYSESGIGGDKTENSWGSFKNDYWLIKMADPTSRINAGGIKQRIWIKDFGFGSGTTKYAVNRTIKNVGAIPQKVMQSIRGVFAPAVMNYSFPGVQPGPCKVRLHFADIYATSKGMIQFDVHIEGVRVLKSFDVFAAAGGRDRAIVKEFDTVVNGNGLQLKFTPKKGGAFVNAIEITPSIGAMAYSLQSTMSPPPEAWTSGNWDESHGGKNAVDGDSSTAWIGNAGAKRWWLSLGYSHAMFVSDVQILFDADSVKNTALLASRDGFEWFDLDEALPAGPCELQYLWIEFMPDEENAVRVPRVLEIEVE